MVKSAVKVSPCKKLHKLINEEIEDETLVIEEVNELVECGATINYTDSLGRSALHNAAVYDMWLKF